MVHFLRFTALMTDNEGMKFITILVECGMVIDPLCIRSYTYKPTGIWIRLTYRSEMIIQYPPKYTSDEINRDN
mgnify:CR=1 FL=1